MANGRRKKMQHQHAQRLLTAKLDTYMITSSSSYFLLLAFVFTVFSLSFVFFWFWNMTVFPLQNGFCSVSSFFRYCFPVYTLRFDGIVWLFFFFKTFSLTFHANSRPPTKQIQNKPFSNIQMHIIGPRHTAIAHCTLLHTPHSTFKHLCMLIIAPLVRTE